MFLTVVVMLCEYLRIHSGDTFHHRRLDMVHLRPFVELDSVILDGALLEFAEGLLDVSGIVDFRVVLANGDAAAADLERVLYARQVGLELLVSARSDVKRFDFA